jgi:hypothetical protein
MLAIFISWFCPAFWWRDSNIYLVLCTSRHWNFLISLSHRSWLRYSIKITLGQLSAGRFILPHTWPSGYHAFFLRVASTDEDVCRPSFISGTVTRICCAISRLCCKYSSVCMKPINTPWGKRNAEIVDVKRGGTCSYNGALNIKRRNTKLNRSLVFYSPYSPLC